MSDFKRGVVLALKEPGWQKFIKIPHSEIATYVQIMNMFDVEVSPKTLRKFSKQQVINYKAKRKSSYSYILTFELLQDIKEATTINELFQLWGFNNDEKIKASKILAGLLKQQADKKTLINGSAAIPLLDVFSFFAMPKIETTGLSKVLGLSLGLFATGVGLFLMPTSTGKGADRTTGTSIPVVYNPESSDTDEMNFTLDDVDQMEEELALEKEADLLLAEAQTEVDLDAEIDRRMKEGEEQNKKDKKKDNDKKSKKRKIAEGALKKGIPLGILGLLMKKGLDTFGNMAPFFLAYMALDAVDDNKKRKK